MVCKQFYAIDFQHCLHSLSGSLVIQRSNFVQLNSDVKTIHWFNLVKHEHVTISVFGNSIQVYAFRNRNRCFYAMDDMWSEKTQILTFGNKIDPKSYLVYERRIENLYFISINCIILGLRNMLKVGANKDNMALKLVENQEY